MSGAAAAMTDHLLAASLEGAAGVALVWIALRMMPAVPPALRAAVWWLAALKFVIGLLPTPAVSLPVLPTSLRPDADAHASAIAGATPGAARAPAPHDGLRIGGGVRGNPAGAHAARGTRSSPVPGDGPRSGDATDLASAVAGWRWIALSIWAVVVGTHGIRIGRSARSVRRLVARAVPWSAEEMAWLQPMLHRLGVRRVPEIRTSGDVAAPLVAGVRRPIVLMPAGAFTPGERAMMLCHELMHVRRRDVAWGWIPAAAERLFFFHPLARLAAREYLVAREAACDAAVVRTLDVASVDYARLLVRLGVAATQPAMVASGSSPSASSLRRRLEMLHPASATRSRRSAWILVLTAAALLPLQLGARQTPQVVLDSLPPSEPSAPASAQRAPEATTPSPAQRVVIHEDRSAAPGVEAMSRAIEEQSLAQRQEVVHVLQGPEALEVQLEIERSLQELAAEVEQVRARQLRDAAERLRAEEQASTVTPGAREAMRLEIERAQRDADEAQRRAALDAIRAEFERARAEYERFAQAAAVARDLEERLTRARETVARLEQSGLPDAHPDLAAARSGVARLEREQASRAPRQVERAAQDRGEMAATIRDQLEQLRREQEALVEQLQRLTAQQQAVIEAQRRLSDAAERLRRELEQR